MVCLRRPYQQTTSLQIFWRLSSTDFTWPGFEYLSLFPPDTCERIAQGVELIKHTGWSYKLFWSYKLLNLREIVMVTSILREVVDLKLTYTVLSLVFISVNVPYILENIFHEIAAQFTLGTYNRLTTFWNLANFISVKLRKSQQQFQQFLLPYRLSCRHTLCHRWKWYLKV